MPLFLCSNGMCLWMWMWNVDVFITCARSEYSKKNAGKKKVNIFWYRNLGLIFFILNIDDQPGLELNAFGSENRYQRNIKKELLLWSRRINKPNSNCTAGSFSRTNSQIDINKSSYIGPTIYLSSFFPAIIRFLMADWFNIHYPLPILVRYRLFLHNLSKN